MENIKIIRREKYTLIGDLVSECGCYNLHHNYHQNSYKNKKTLMPLAPKVTAVAAMQADEVIRRVVKELEV